MHLSSLRSALASAFQISLRPSTSQKLRPSLQHATAKSAVSNPRFSRNPFSTSALRLAKKGGPVKTDRRITLIRYFLYHPTQLTPRPLRFSRNRALRHWTIHRAWLLFQRKVKLNRQLELERQYNAMAAANEELRVGAGDGGKLFRRAQMKTGVWSIPERGGGVPIEYARGMMEWMGSTGGLGSGGSTSGSIGSKAKIWDSDWKRH